MNLTPTLNRVHGTPRAEITQAVLYGRASPQANIAQKTIDDQLQACREAATEQGWEIIGTHSDIGVSGTVPCNDRPGLIAAREHLGPGVALVMWDQDRLERPSYDNWNEMSEFQAAFGWLLTDTGGCIYTAKAGRFIHGDNLTPMDFMLFAVESFVNASERERIADRTSRGIKYAVYVNNRAVGRHPPFGKMRDPLDKKALIDCPKEIKAIERMMQLSQQGAGVEKITNVLTVEMPDVARNGRWHKSTVKRVLERYNDPTFDQKVRKAGATLKSQANGSHLPERVGGGHKEERQRYAYRASAMEQMRQDMGG